MTDTMPAFLIGGLVVVIFLAIVVVMYRSRANSSQWDSQEQDFEQNMLRQFGRVESTARAMPVMPPSLPARAASPVGPPSTVASNPSPAGVAPSALDNLPEFVRSVAAKLTAARMMESIEGPLRSRNPEIIGTILCMRGNKKIAVIESGWKTPDPDLEMIVSLLDGVIIAGPGAEPIFVRRLQSFIGDSIQL